MNVAVREIRKEYRTDPVKEIKCYRGSRQDNRNECEHLPREIVTRMVSRTGRRVQVCIAVVDHVKLPHPSHPVQKIVHPILCDKLEDEQGDDEFNP